MNKKKATFQETVGKLNNSLETWFRQNAGGLGETILYLRFGENLNNCSDISIRNKCKLSTDLLAKEFGHLDTSDLCQILSFGRCKLTFNFEIDRNLDDHKKDLSDSGFVLNWTLQREETLP